MIHKHCLGTCGMIPVVERNKNLNVLREYSTFTKQWYPINSFFSQRKSIMYTVALLWRTRSGSVPWDGRDIESTAGPEIIRSRPPDWSAGLEIPFVFLYAIRSPHQSGTQAQLFHAGFALAVWLKAASPSSPPCPTLLASAEEGNKNRPGILPH